jgi:hypothetical protein
MTVAAVIYLAFYGAKVIKWDGAWPVEVAVKKRCGGRVSGGEQRCGAGAVTHSTDLRTLLARGDWRGALLQMTL